MKKIFIIFLLLVAIYWSFSFVKDSSWFAFGKQSNEADVSESIENLVIDVSGVSTTIIPENRSDLYAELKGKGELTVDKNRDAIEVNYKREWFDWFSFFEKTKLTIYIPENYNKDMKIDIGSGNLNFSDSTNNQPMNLEQLSIDMSSGNLKINNLVVEQFEHDGSSGNVAIHSLATETGSFDISSGNINIKKYSGQLAAELSSGNFDVQMEQLAGPIDVEVSSGKVMIDLPDDADFSLNGKVSSGDISNDFPLNNYKENRREIEGTHGSGKHDINLRVSSGRIELK